MIQKIMEILLIISVKLNYMKKINYKMMILQLEHFQA